MQSLSKEVSGYSIGRVHLLADLQRLLFGSSGSAPAPCDQKEVKDPGEDRTPTVCAASERGLL